MNAPAPLGVVGHYNLLEALDASGPGDLYRARDTHHGRTVIVRWLPREYAADPAARRTLLDAARGTAALSHPNVTTLFEVGEHDGRVYLAFEFLTGRTLRAEMAGRPMNMRRALETAIQIGDAVAEAHAAGFAHGGLSPESVTITSRGHAKIPAFPLAVRSGFAASATSDDVRLEDYESPEEARGEPPDDRSDVYSVGAILYEMLAAKRPSHRGAAAPGAANVHVPGAIDDVVLKAVAPNPALRYQSMAALVAALRWLSSTFDAHGFADDELVAGPSRGRVVPLVAGTLALVAAAAVFWWLTRP